MPSSAPFTMRNAYGTLSSSGDATLIAAPGLGKRIVIRYRRFARNVATDVTVPWKDGATTTDSITLTAEVPGILEVLDNDNVIRLSENAALGVNLSASVSVSWRVRYSIENV